MFNLRFILPVKKICEVLHISLFFCTFAAEAEYIAKSE